MKKIFAVLTLLILSTTAKAGVLYDAGDVALDTGKCVAETCYGAEDWWVISGFTADSDWNISGFEFFANDIDNVGTSNYQSTSWKIISGSNPYGVSLFSGSTVGAVSTSTSSIISGATFTNINLTSFLLSDLDIDLSSGDYYLAQHHNYSVDSTFTALSTIDRGDLWYHTDYTKNFFTDGAVVAQKIYGTSTVSVPEPAMIALFGLGLLGLSYSRKKKSA